MPRRKTTSLTTKPYSAASKNPANAKDSPTPKTSFLDLPAEIRNTIYELSLSQQTIVFPKASKTNKKGRAKCPGVVMACKQTYQESANTFYAKVTFCFKDQGKMLSWLRKIGTKKRALLQEVIIDKTLTWPVLPDYMAALTGIDKGVGDHAREMLLMLERRLRDFGTPLPVNVYKIRMRKSMSGRASMFYRWESQERVFGQWVTVRHMGRTELY